MLLLLLIIVSAAFAQAPSLPTVTFEAPVAWPAEALAQGAEATVLLEIDVSDMGEVFAARAVESSDPRFEAPAVDAALAFRFSPAVDAEGRPASARIQYRLRFSAERAPTLSVEGSILDETDELPVEGLVVEARRGDELRFSTTDGQGGFRFAGLDSGEWTITASGGVIFQDKSVDVTVSEGTVQQVQLYLEPGEARASGRDDLVIEVVGVVATDEVTERVLSSDEIEFLPGTSGDVVKAVQNLPGVARAPSGIGQLIIRGTPPEDSAFGLDGARIPLVFHFGGLTTVLSTEIVDEVAYLPGSYGVRYGRALGGFVDLRVDPEVPEEPRSVASIDVFQTQLFTERKLGERTSLTFAGRRSYIDAVLTPLLSDGEFTVQAPRYYDAQARLVTEGDRGSFDAMYLFSDDRFRFLGKDADGEDETLAAFATTFHKLRLRWLADVGDRWELESVLLAGPEQQTFEFVRGSEAYEKNLRLNLREELRRETDEDTRVGYRFGVDLMCARDRYLYDVSFYPGPEEGEALYCAPGPYAETTVRVGTTSITPGIRGDALLLDGGTVLAADPRIGVRQPLGTSTTLKAGTGLYSQFPLPRELADVADLGPERSWQSSLGVEHQLAPPLQLDLSVFYNDLDNLVVGREDRFYFFTGPPIRRDFDTEPYANLGTGRTYGVEALLRYSDDRTVAQFAATISRSDRTGRDGVTQLFEYDQPLILNALASRELPRNWRLGARVRYGSGNPYTPVANRIYSLEERDWIPVYNSGETDRLKPFFSLDLRVDRVYEFRNWTLTTYLDIQNATYFKNVEVMAYSEDYGEEQPVEGLPPVPSFGFKGEW